MIYWQSNSIFKVFERIIWLKNDSEWNDLAGTQHVLWWHSRAYWIVTQRVPWMLKCYSLFYDVIISGHGHGSESFRLESQKCRWFHVESQLFVSFSKTSVPFFNNFTDDCSFKTVMCWTWDLWQYICKKGTRSFTGHSFIMDLMVLQLSFISEENTA